MKNVKFCIRFPFIGFHATSIWDFVTFSPTPFSAEILMEKCHLNSSLNVLCTINVISLQQIKHFKMVLIKYHINYQREFHKIICILFFMKSRIF